MSWATIGAAAIGAGASYFGKGKTEQGQAGGVAVAPQYSFTEPRLQLESDFISNNLKQIDSGNFPGYYQKAEPAIRNAMTGANNMAFFGSKGNRMQSTMGTAAQVGAMTGAGPGATINATNKASARYEQASKDIESFIQQQGVNVTQTAMGQLLQASNSMPQGPQYVTYGATQGTYQPGWGDSMSGIMKSLPYLMNNPSTTPGTGDTSSPAWLNDSSSNAVYGQNYGLNTPSANSYYGNGDANSGYFAGQNSFVNSTSASAPTNTSYLGFNSSPSGFNSQNIQQYSQQAQWMADNHQGDPYYWTNK